MDNHFRYCLDQVQDSLDHYNLPLHAKPDPDRPGNIRIVIPTPTSHSFVAFAVDALRGGDVDGDLIIHWKPGQIILSTAID